ncbi:MAG: hypothetical protein GXP31_13530 [Kiritimatiellaeota bacterium]|nr:hypothetical protein [Kiritimatiellota bacterium]
MTITNTRTAENHHHKTGPKKKAEAGLGAAILAVLALLGPLAAAAQTNSDCMDCHDDRTLTAMIGGRKVSAYINIKAYRSSVHGDLECVTCHSDLEGTDFPHKEDLQPVKCAQCHEDEAKDLQNGPHGKWKKVPGQPAASCIVCHGTHDVLGPNNAKSTVSPVSVGKLCGRCHSKEKKVYGHSIHSASTGAKPNAACTDCHRGHGMVQPKIEKIELQTCGECHPEEAKRQARSVHARAALKGDPLAPSCITCHNHHDILPSSDPKSATAKLNTPVLCGRCHHEGSRVSLERNIPQKNILQNYSLSIHGQGLLKMGLRVTAVCTSCHNSHLILEPDNPDASINPENVAKTCMKCHSRIEQVHVKVISGKLWEQAPHEIPSCADCHPPHKIRRTPANLKNVANKECVGCHANRNLSMERDGKKLSLFVDEKAFKASRHSSVACAQCHNEVSTVLKRPCAAIKHKVDCSICHAETVQKYQTGIHGKRAAAGDPNAPTCLTCHSAHTAQSHLSPTSPTFAMNVPKLCGECHTQGKPVAEVIANRIPQAKNIVNSYIDSVHGQGLLKAGLVVAANCASCHTAHHELPKSDPDSSVNPAHLADTCGACHKGIERQFKTSVHWPGRGKTKEKLPVCEDCHTSHTISRVTAKGFRTRMMNQCGKCHQTEAKSYFNTFHGKSSRLGYEGAAKCYDCHGVHNILPPDDPRSTLSYRNAVYTCKKCHPGAHRKFAGYLTHATHHNPKKYPYLYYTYIFMTTLLVGTLTFFLLHTLFWLLRLWKERASWRPVKNRTHDRFYIRFSLRQRIMHLILLLCFFTLGITGMTLKFSYMGWAVLISRVFGGFAVTGVLHRMAATMLIGVFIVHLWHVAKLRRATGRSWLKFIFGKNSLMFNLNDIKEFWQHLKWFFGAGERPKFGRFTYWEKFDYFAVFWGVCIIGTSGLMLWFPTFFTRFLPGRIINIATIIHSDEALLAVAFIFTIHFFNTHFRPDKFPMDPVIFTGRVSVEELKHDKPGEYEQLTAMADPEKRLTGPMSRAKLHWIRAFGFVALGVGLTLIFLILYAMLFGYK